MKKLITLASILSVITACGGGSSGGGGGSKTDTTAPTISEVTPVTSPSDTAYPSYTFNSDEAGTLMVSGKCSSDDTTVVAGENTITLGFLTDQTYNNCILTVTDATGNTSGNLHISNFEVITPHEQSDNYIKLDNNGVALTVQNLKWDESGSEEESTQWSCVKDIARNLVWEVKTDDGQLRDTDWTYMNNTTINSPTNWDPIIDGSEDKGSCSFDEGNVSLATCDTEQYIAAVNAQTLCGKSDWRLPTADTESVLDSEKELLSLLRCEKPDCTGSYPYLDQSYFPNTFSGVYWSKSPYSDFDNTSYVVAFDVGFAYSTIKSFTAHVRLVRDSD